MGTAAYGGKGFKGRAAVTGERPIGAAGCRQQHNRASCQPPPLPSHRRGFDALGCVFGGVPLGRRRPTRGGTVFPLLALHQVSVCFSADLAGARLLHATPAQVEGGSEDPGPTPVGNSVGRSTRGASSSSSSSSPDPLTSPQPLWPGNTGAAGSWSPHSPSAPARGPPTPRATRRLPARHRR